MKKISIALLGLTLATVSYAQNAETPASVWDKTVYLKVGINSDKISSDEFPTVGGVYSSEYKSQFGLGIQNGKTFWLHKEPLGNVLTFGVDWTWVDLNVSTFKKKEPASSFNMGSDSPYNMPWHHKKWMASYGMSVGPSITLCPFSASDSDFAKYLRLNLYFHLGYSVGGVLFDKVKKPNSDSEKTQAAWGHGLFTAFGASVSWKSYGLGYEFRNNASDGYQYLNSSFKQPDKMKMKETFGRIYFQFLFK